MKTLAVYYSKTGNTKKVADAVVSSLGCDRDELAYDENAKTVSCSLDPKDYERVILLSPIWAFSLAEPMKLYLKEHGAAIGRYSLIVTCGKLGLRGCVKNCVSAIGKRPEKCTKFRSKDVTAGDFDVKEAL